MKTHRFIIPLILSLVFILFCFTQFSNTTETERLREKHKQLLDNSPFKQTQRLTKTERKSKGLPPNAYYEQLWELTLDPNTGRPMPERAELIQNELRTARAENRGGGGDNFSPWVERGPNNVAGRTRGMMFDPNDTDFNRVFAGSVSGGLWVNEDITNPASAWSLVSGIPANLRVNVIIHDPNNTSTFYLGAGESFSNGFGIGRGVWKSTDGGVNWTNIFGGASGTITSNAFVDGIFYINDIVARDLGTTTELFIAVSGEFYDASGGNANEWNGLLEQGLYKSTDGGSNWSQIALATESNGTQPNPCDLEIDINNNVWLTTTLSDWAFFGGKIFRSTDGTTFNLINTIPGASRTELEPSSTDANRFWVAADIGGQADLFTTDNAFTTFTALAEPNDVDLDIPSTDYTRGQAFWDLPIEADASDNLYIGGINLFKSEDAGATWQQISKWSNNNNLAGLNVPIVHADQHAIVFRPGTGNEDEAIFGTDGGVYYTPDISVVPTSISISNIETNYNTTQFYYGSIGPSASNEILFGGTQDNGTVISQNSASGVNPYDDFFGFFSGDGSYSEIDVNGGLTGFGNGEYLVLGHIHVNYRLGSPAVSSTSNAMANGYDIHTSTTSEGNFINEAELDHNLNILYANTSTSSVNRISRFVLGSNSATETIFSDALLTSSPSAFKVSPFTTTATKLFVGLRTSTLIRVDNADTTPTFTDISGPLFLGSISDIEFGQTEDEIFVTFHNYGVSSIWFTDNGGTSWTNIEGDLPDIPVKCILQNPLLPQELIIGTELGVWRTSDYTSTGVQWVQSYNGMSDVLVLDLDLRTVDNTILASTHGRGLYTSTFTNQLSIDESSQELFAITPTLSDGNIRILGKDLGKSMLSIYDISGKKVFSSELNFNENSNQDLSLNIASGTYIVNINTEDNRKASQKIVIK
ncbi:T9SS type A sorting domain-containing protein [Winogradskyella sp. A2]|uniref:T9SS type A sorting domain-containing protein n=1 Tax=Winogradskyella sp. A2 TaxID=3366944 RepID=UPI00398C825A